MGGRCLCVRWDRLGDDLLDDEGHVFDGREVGVEGRVLPYVEASRLHVGVPVGVGEGGTLPCMAEFMGDNHGCFGADVDGPRQARG